jgi:hypothetical protein
LDAVQDVGRVDPNKIGTKSLVILVGHKKHWPTTAVDLITLVLIKNLDDPKRLNIQ